MALEIEANHTIFWKGKRANLSYKRPLVTYMYIVFCLAFIRLIWTMH